MRMMRAKKGREQELSENVTTNSAHTSGKNKQSINQQPKRCGNPGFVQPVKALLQVSQPYVFNAN